MKILIINSGSSSIKYQVISWQDQEVLAKGSVEKIAEPKSCDFNVFFKSHRHSVERCENVKNFNQAVEVIVKLLTDKEKGVLRKISEIDAIGHRVVQGAEVFKSATKLNVKVINQIESLTELAPLHQPGAVKGIRSFADILPKTPMVAVFDTVFHTTMPDYAARYAVPKNAYEDWKIKRYGAHGTSHKFVSERVAELLGKKGKVITCHLGNGSSISAVKDGVCVDTSMGLTPLEGMVMGTRSGDIDPTIVTMIMKHSKMSAEEAISWLNKKCGLLGVSGISNDMRDLWKAFDEGNKDAILAIKMLCYRIKKYIGAYAAALGGLDAIVFAGGIGERDPGVRAMSLEGLEFLGVELDLKKNSSAKREEVAIHAKTSKVKIYIIPTDEEWQIAKETVEVLNGR